MKVEENNTGLVVMVVVVMHELTSLPLSLLLPLPISYYFLFLFFSSILKDEVASEDSLIYSSICEFMY